MPAALVAETDPGGTALIIIIVLAFIGAAFMKVAERAAYLPHILHRWAIGLGIAVGMIVFLGCFFLRAPAHGNDPLSDYFFNGLFYGFGAGLSLTFLIPISILLWVYVIRPPFRLFGRMRRAGAEHRRHWMEERRRRQEEREYARSAPDRERQYAQQRTAQKRREDARARCELFFNLHRPELAKRFEEVHFKEFTSRHLADSYPPEYVEERATQLLDIMQKHLEKAGHPEQKKSLADIAAWFLEEKAKIDALPLNPEDKEQMIADLEARFALLQQKHIRRMHP